MASTYANQNGDCNINGSFDKLLPGDFNDFAGEPEISPQIPLDSSAGSAELGEPEITPRIGDAYQVDISSIIQDSHMDLENIAYYNMLIGLPIPLTWISPMKCDTLESHKSSRNISDFRRVEKLEPYSDGHTVGISSNKPSHKTGKPLAEMKEKIKIRKCRGQSYILVPGQSSGHWSDDEKASFLLGLYVFEKNFVEVRRFLETKEIGTILCFYYGRFYGSKDYIRWSECRNAKGKKCVYGQRIFSGLRQQELLSRILPTVSAECQNALLEVSKSFTDEKMSLVDYLSSLKAMVGMKILVKAVGIGTGKQDLTRMVLEPSKSNPVISSRVEIPTGKACSSLTTTEIVKFLNGDYRLSKARSNDLFWEAVWPRLLARGWHSEQPKNQGHFFGSRNCLVFLVPGVNKFSRRKLAKGNQYFDSVTDVLRKVANEPGLIELDSTEDDGNKNKEPYKCTGERKLSQVGEGDQPARQRHHYLQPRTSNRCSHVKFTVVDTSLSGGAVRELRSLPSEFSDMLNSQDCDEESDEDTSEEITEESNAINSISHNASATDNGTSLRIAKSGRKMLQRMNELEVSASYQDTRVYPDNDSKSVTNLNNKKDLLGNKRSTKVSKPLLSQKLGKGNEDYVAPITKRCKRLPVCIHGETSDCVISSWTYPGLDNVMSSGSGDIYEFTEDLSYVNSCQDKLSSTISSKCSPSNSVECTRTMIDLNLPRVFPEYEHDVFTTESSKDQDKQTLKSDDNCLPKSSAYEVKSEEQFTVNPRRHSTRNRPPTTRALEALANGFLTVSRRRKGKDVISSHEDLGFRPLHRARVEVNESTNSHVSSPMKETENGPNNSANCHSFNTFQVLPEENDEAVSGH